MVASTGFPKDNLSDFTVTYGGALKPDVKMKLTKGEAITLCNKQDGIIEGKNETIELLKEVIAYLVITVFCLLVFIAFLLAH